MTEGPERPTPGGPEARPGAMWTALLRPWGLVVLVIGGFFFAATLEWWIPPLTLATYASLVFLAARRPPGDATSPGPRERTSRPQRSPDQRVRRLPPGETRRRATAALEAYNRVLVAVEESDEATRDTLSHAVSKLHRAFGRLLDLAEARAGQPRSSRPRDGHRGEDARAADAELSGAPEKLLALRSEVVRVSIEGGEEAAERAAALADSLDAWNRRLDASLSRIDER